MLHRVLSTFLVLLAFANPSRASDHCFCPPGFEIGVGGRICSKKTSAIPSQVPNPTDVVVGDWDASYLSHGLHVVETTGDTHWPFSTRMYNYPVVDSVSQTLPGEDFNLTQAWHDHVTPASSVLIKGNRDGVWFSKTFCLNIPANKHYVVFAGGDNYWRVKINGQDFAQCTEDYCFRNGLFLGQDMGAGNNFVEIKYKNDGGAGALWFEVFENSNQEVKTLPPNSLNTLFTTKSLVGSKWDYSGPSGDICPAGFTYDSCATHQCVHWENVQCEATVSASDSNCSEPVQVKYYNTTDRNVSAVWSLYKLDSNDNRITPAVATTLKDYNIDETWSGTLQELFAGQAIQNAWLGQTENVRFELVTSITDRTSTDHWEHSSKFTISPVPTEINVMNNPNHPDNGPISPSATGSFTIFPDADIQFQDHVLDANAPPPSGYDWTLPLGFPSSGGNNPISSQWNAPTPQGGVTLKVKTSFPNGCVSIATAKLLIADLRGPSVPTAFTPNGDGLNDVFKPLGLNLDWKVFRVYNRWGEVVYDHTGGGQPKGWDGNLPGGRSGAIDPHPQGTAVFVVYGLWRHMGTSEYHTYKGTVTLIR